MDKILAVFDADSVYTMRFMEYFKKNGITGFDITVFSEQESIMEFLQYQRVEILLLGEGFLASEPAAEHARHIFYLTDHRREAKGKKEYIIFKYQSAGKILSDILSLYTRLEYDTQSVKSLKTSIISIFSPVSGGVKSTFAWDLASALSENMNALYIPLEPYPVNTIPSFQGGGQSISEYLYYLKENNSDLLAKLGQLLSFRGKLACLTGLSHGFDLLSLNEEDASHLVEEWRSRSEYEAVIFYLGFYSEAAVKLMDTSDIVLIVSSEDPYEKEVLKEWKRQMASLNIHTEDKKYRYIEISEENRKDIAIQCSESLSADNK